jgi:hypothetical protein
MLLTSTGQMDAPGLERAAEWKAEAPMALESESIFDALTPPPTMIWGILVAESRCAAGY